MPGKQGKESLLDAVARFRTWDGLTPDRLIPLLESAEVSALGEGETLFEQFHPAKRCYLLVSGIATQFTSSASRTGMVHHGTVDWPYAALGWSGFLPPQRYGSTVVARSSLRLLHWSHEKLAELFYADPGLAIRFFSLVLESVTRQLVALRAKRIESVGAALEPPVPEPFDARRPVVGRADSCLRRSAFFAPFDEAIVDSIADAAELVSRRPGERIVRQGEPLEGLLLLASGRCNAFFETADERDLRLLPFRRFRNRIGIIAGVPTGEGFAAEATVYAETHCWIYRVPQAAIESAMRADLEFGRAFQQRLLVRLAGLIGALQVERNPEEAEPEVALVANIVANSQARLPVTSDLYKVPHLLSHRLTIGNAFATLGKVAETGRYHERLLAGRCTEAITNLAAENAFYTEIIAACEAVVSAEDSVPASSIRASCDERVAHAFGHIDCRVRDEHLLPDSSGNIIILNHLACPEYYQLPNGYHFSFDTAFVSAIVWRHYSKSPVRVVRESPDSEFGHNLFYRRLGHMTVPTLESAIAGVSDEEFRARRRAAGERFFGQGSELLGAGTNLVICPEGQSQPAELSPARFHTGAFRLAVETGARVVPIALAGFHRRFKDGPLVACIGEAVDVSAAMQANGWTTVREFADGFRDEFAGAVSRAAAIAAEPARLSHPDAWAGYRSLPGLR